MRINIEKAVNSSVSFLSNEVMKVSDLKDRFLMFAALGAVKVNPSGIVNAYKPTLKAVGIIDADDMVDTDAIRSALSMGFSNVPRFTALGFTFSQSDAEALLQRMEE